MFSSRVRGGISGVLGKAIDGIDENGLVWFDMFYSAGW
jgi:hypothetical protein